MSNPVLVETIRGELVESRHCGAVAVADAAGRLVWALGDVERPVYPRSAVKAMQALVLVESGAADRYGLTDEELALACASHGGEPGHVATAQAMLARAGLDETALRCGSHWPLHQPSARELAREGGQASALHNNCSGKHSAFLCAACAIGADVSAYTEPTHPVQREVKAALEHLTGASLPDEVRAVDGCSVPTWAMPLAALARGFARFGSGTAMPPLRARAAARLRAACMAHPWHVAGSGRFCTEAMQALAGRLFVKTGAEGVYGAALPDQGLGIAVKCDDGAGRAAEVMIASAMARFLAPDGTVLQRFIRPTVRNWNGIETGMLRPTAAFGM